MAEGSRKPWWAAALVGGVGTGLAIATALGLGATSAQGHEPRVAAASISLPPGTLSLDERLSRMELAIDELKHEVGELRDRLPPKRTQ